MEELPAQVSDDFIDYVDDDAYLVDSWHTYQYFFNFYLYFRESSVITDNFGGLLRSSMQCPGCNVTSVKYEYCQTLEFEIPPTASSTLITLEDCMMSYTKEEIVGYRCPCEVSVYVSICL